MYGKLTPEMIKQMRPYLKGRVFDLGCGAYPSVAFELNPFIDDFHLVDKEEIQNVPSNTLVHETLFTDFPPLQPEDVALISWPVNSGGYGLPDLLRACHTVIYVGVNDGFTGCGTPQLWNHLLQREPVVYVESSRDDLIVYQGPRQAKDYNRHEQNVLKTMKRFYPRWVP